MSTQPPNIHACADCAGHLTLVTAHDLLCPTWRNSWMNAPELWRIHVPGSSTTLITTTLGAADVALDQLVELTRADAR